MNVGRISIPWFMMPASYTEAAARAAEAVIKKEHPYYVIVRSNDVDEVTEISQPDVADGAEGPPPILLLTPIGFDSYDLDQLTKEAEDFFGDIGFVLIRKPESRADLRAKLTDAIGLDVSANPSRFEVLYLPRDQFEAVRTILSEAA